MAVHGGGVNKITKTDCRPAAAAAAAAIRERWVVTSTASSLFSRTTLAVFPLFHGLLYLLTIYGAKHPGLSTVNEIKKCLLIWYSGFTYTSH